jgi:hypothetical protein
MRFEISCRLVPGITSTSPATQDQEDSFGVKKKKAALRSMSYEGSKPGDLLDCQECKKLMVNTGVEPATLAYHR